MDIYLRDLTPVAQDFILNYRKEIKADEPIAILYNPNDTDNCAHVAGSFEHIQKLIPILKDMGYIDFNLSYEDCGIWTLRWHNPEFDGLEWMLVG